MLVLLRFCSFVCFFPQYFFFVPVFLAVTSGPVDKTNSSRLNTLSLNVRGLKNQVKRRSIFRYLKDQNCAFFPTSLRNIFRA